MFDFLDNFITFQTAQCHECRYDPEFFSNIKTYRYWVVSGSVINKASD